MRPELRAELERLNADFTEVTGRSVRHFYCPILEVDERAPLCRGHVVNQAFSDAPPAWTVQRSDVESFFGSKVEADFTKLESAKRRPRFEHLTASKSHGRIKPEILLDGQRVEYFVPKGRIPDNFTPLWVESDAERRLLALKLAPVEVSAALGRDWKLQFSLDLRAAALVSLLKAAFLTKFALLGYRYALSGPGRAVGVALLGRFLRECQGLPRREVADLMLEQFAGFTTMVRPVLDGALPYRGTIVDRRLLLCWSPLGFAWASIVFVPAAGLHAVVLPVESRPEAAALFERFLDGATESLEVREAQLSGSGDDLRWEVSPRSVNLAWPKAESL